MSFYWHSHQLSGECSRDRHYKSVCLATLSLTEPVLCISAGHSVTVEVCDVICLDLICLDVSLSEQTCASRIIHFWFWFALECYCRLCKYDHHIFSMMVSVKAVTLYDLYTSQCAFKCSKSTPPVSLAAHTVSSKWNSFVSLWRARGPLWAYESFILGTLHLHNWSA